MSMSDTLDFFNAASPVLPHAGQAATFSALLATNPTMPAALQPSPAAAHHNEARAKHAAKPSCDVLLGTDEQYKLIT